LERGGSSAVGRGRARPDQHFPYILRSSYAADSCFLHRFLTQNGTGCGECGETKKDEKIKNAFAIKTNKFYCPQTMTVQHGHVGNELAIFVDFVVSIVTNGGI
jgi:hypothetical protein